MGDKAKRSFGTLVARHNAKGVLSAWQARYRSPLKQHRQSAAKLPS